MKKAIVSFWKGLTGIIAAVADWFTLILGMKDESKYGVVTRRIVGGSFAFLMLILAVSVGIEFTRTVMDEFEVDRSWDYKNYNTQYLSRTATMYWNYDGNDGFVRNRDGDITIKNIAWIAKPLGEDSLVLYSKDKKRGYFNIYTGEVAIKPQYKHAWIFSSGLAAVDDNGWMKFVDAQGNVAIDLKTPYLSGMDGYVFHGNHCVVHNNRRDKVGLIDKRGKWVLDAKYLSIEPVDTFWVVNSGDKQCLISDNMKTILPFMEGDLWVEKGFVTATMKDHTLRKYTLQGEIIDDFIINTVGNLMYDTNEIRYVTSQDYDDDGKLTGETKDKQPVPVQKMASCKVYEAESGWYGLMSPNGKVITPPSYYDITAIGYDLYFCKRDPIRGEILNGKGEKVKTM